MAKRPPRQELRAAPTRAPYRRAKSPSAPPPTLDLPMPPPGVAAPAPSPLDLPDFAALTHTALGFAGAALAALPEPGALIAREPRSPEPPPGRAPAGDARSLRSANQFALIYRSGSALVSRRGSLGEHGVWRVVEYPTTAQAAHAYAAECSRLLDQGFVDVV